MIRRPYLKPLPLRRPPLKLSFFLLLLLSIPFLFLTSSTQLSPNLFKSVIPPSPSVALVIVSDELHSSKFKTQAISVQCYGKAHNYTFFHLIPSQVAPQCLKRLKGFFYQKHCTIAEWLLTRPPGSVALVLDGDVVGGMSNQSLDRWLEYQFDVAMYERSWNFEVAAGNYIVRNTKFARQFLHHWASYEDIQPPGFSSADNGALHMALLDALSIRGRNECFQMYRSLTALVTELTPYFKFIACTKALLGPAREHVVRIPDSLESLDAVNKRREKAGKIVGRIVIFPRFFGFALDGAVHGMLDVRGLYPFYHGVKEEGWKDKYRECAQDDDDCMESVPKCGKIWKVGWKEGRKMGSTLKSSDSYAMKSMGSDYSIVPRWGHVDENCYENMWCGPLGEGFKVWPKGYVEKNGTLKEIEFSERGVDAQNEFIASMRVGAGDRENGEEERKNIK